MPIEAELKAVVRDPARVRAALGEHAPGEVNVYRDVYYDTPDRRYSQDGREIRLRVVDGIRSLLTYKDPAVDRASGSKPEYETAVADPVAMDAVLRKLGLEEGARRAECDQAGDAGARNRRRRPHDRAVHRGRTAGQEHYA
jgi:adenylate cyclase class 2